MTYLGMQIMVEGLALAAFGFMHQMTTEPLLKQLLRYVMSDEARHVAFGVLSLKEYYARAHRRRDAGPRRVHVRSRGAHARPVPPAGGLGPHGRAREGRARAGHGRRRSRDVPEHLVLEDRARTARSSGCSTATAAGCARTSPSSASSSSRTGSTPARSTRCSTRSPRTARPRRPECDGPRRPDRFRSHRPPRPGGRCASTGTCRRAAGIELLYRLVGRVLDPDPTGKAHVTATDVRPEPRPRRPRMTPADERINKRSSIPFIALHFIPLLAIFTGITRTAVLLFLVTYLGRMFLITAGYHRYFSHRSYRMARFPQFLMAFGCTTAAQKGPLWWAGHHRVHHRYADTDQDIHSPKRGLLVEPGRLDPLRQVRRDRVRRDQGLREVPGAALPQQARLDRAVGARRRPASSSADGAASSSGSSRRRSCCGTRRSSSTRSRTCSAGGSTTPPDTSRNSLFIALITGGEGWHNNHHRYPSSARQGFRWWQIDTTYYGLRLLSFVGIVHDLRKPPARVLAEAATSGATGLASPIGIGAVGPVSGPPNPVVRSTDHEFAGCRVTRSDRLPRWAR